MPTTLPELLPALAGGGNLIEQHTGREALSHTRLSALLACPQKYAYTYEDRIEPIKRPAALSMGAAYHKAIETGDAVEPAAELYETASRSSQDDEDQARINQTIVVSAATLYLSRHERDPTAAHEFGYRIRLRNPANGYLSRTFDVLGYADEVQSVGDHFRLVENKLVGQIQASNVRRLPLDRQVALEAYGVWRATGRVVREVSYRFMRKPSIRPRKDESVDVFCDRVAEDYVTRPDFYLVEEDWIRSSDDLVRIEAELWEWAQQLRRQRQGSLWTRNTSHCAEYGGCPFVPLCLGEDAHGLYQTREERSTAQETRNHLPPVVFPVGI